MSCLYNKPAEHVTAYKQHPYNKVLSCKVSLLRFCINMHINRTSLVFVLYCNWCISCVLTTVFYTNVLHRHWCILQRLFRNQAAVGWWCIRSCLPVTWGMSTAVLWWYFIQYLQYTIHTYKKWLKSFPGRADLQFSTDLRFVSLQPHTGLWDHGYRTSAFCDVPLYFPVSVDAHCCYARMDELIEVPDYIPRWFTCPQMVTHPSTNRARCGATSRPMHYHSAKLCGHSLSATEQHTMEKYEFPCRAKLQNSLWLLRNYHLQGDVDASSKMSMRKLLKSQWANWRMWYKMQPLDYIRLVYNNYEFCVMCNV